MIIRGTGGDVRGKQWVQLDRVAELMPSKLPVPAHPRTPETEHAVHVPRKLLVRYEAAYTCPLAEAAPSESG